MAQHDIPNLNFVFCDNSLTFLLL